MKLVDIDEIKAWIQNWIKMMKYDHPYAKSQTIPLAELMDIFERVPKIDAVPVVWCKDCEYCIQKDIDCSVCNLTRLHVKDNDYCSLGEQKRVKENEKS